MFIKIGNDIAVRFQIPTTVVHLLHVHPSRRSDLVEPERLSITPTLDVDEYYDGFANHRTRICAPAGTVRFFSEAIIRDSGELDAHQPQAVQLDVSEIPTSVLKFLPPSRYCEVDSELMDFAWRTFCKPDPGGNGFKRFVTLFTNIFGSITSKLGSIVPR